MRLVLFLSIIFGVFYSSVGSAYLDKSLKRNYDHDENVRLSCDYSNDTSDRDLLFYRAYVVCQKHHKRYDLVAEGIQALLDLNHYIGYYETYFRARTKDYTMMKDIIKDDDYTVEELRELTKAGKFIMEDFILSSKSDDYQNLRKLIDAEKSEKFFFYSFHSMIYALDMRYTKVIKTSPHADSLEGIATIKDIIHYSNKCLEQKKLKAWTVHELEVLHRYCSLYLEMFTALLPMEIERQASAQKCTAIFGGDDNHSHDGDGNHPHDGDGNHPCMTEYLKDHGYPVRDRYLSYKNGAEFKGLRDLMIVY